MIECLVETINGFKTEYAYSYDEYDYNFNIYGDGKKYSKNFITFDIETSKYNKGNDLETFMYIWQACIDDDVVFGSTWKEFKMFLDRCYNRMNTSKKVVIYIHNLSYEFQFMKNFFEWEDVFATDEHVILKACTKEFEFRCSYKLSNMSLDKFIENTPGHFYIKGSDFSYNKLRLPGDILEKEEYGYCYNDVRGLYHSIMDKLEEDTLESIPLTSTGYVRRDCRNALRGREYRKQFKKSEIDLEMYKKLLRAFRGGNTASSRYFANMIIDNVKSYDISSSYPFVMMSYEYPQGPFMYTSIDSRNTLDKYNRKYCTIAEYSFINLRLKNKYTPIPYVSISKCNKADSDALVYNGRVLEGRFFEMTLTNVDFEIIDRMYDYDEMYVDDFYFARKKLLPKPLREQLLKYFTDKTTLKGIDEMYYFYMKQKNKLNAIYGMSVSHIVHENYIFDTKDFTITRDTMSEERENEELKKYFKSRNSFLCFQWGVWVTAYARARLQELIDIIGIDVVYCDTDSVKYIGDYETEIEKINRNVIERENNVDVPFHVKHEGKDIYMGVWDKEKPYNRFITLGAKKYAYEQNGKLGVTVSGLNKKNAPLELKEKGGLEAFKNGTIFTNAGRVSATYVDTKIHTLKINGVEIVNGSYVTLLDTTYTLGITDTMLSIINSCKVD